MKDRQRPRPRFWLQKAHEERAASGSSRPATAGSLQLDLGCGRFKLDGRVRGSTPFTHQHTPPALQGSCVGKLVKGRPSPRAQEGVRASGRWAAPDAGHGARRRTHSPLCPRARWITEEATSSWDRKEWPLPPKGEGS